MTQMKFFNTRGSKEQLEEGLDFQPKFDDHGLIPAIATDEDSGQVLMFAWMNREALQKTITTGRAHFWSRSRQTLWQKGEESGNTLEISELMTDCDQDVIWMRVGVAGNGVACHTERQSCFYRKINFSESDDRPSLTFTEK